MVKGFVKNSCAIQSFEKLFNTYLDWVFSSFLNLESWILILILEILNLESWFLILGFLLESWVLLDSFLKLLTCSWFTWDVLWFTWVVLWSFELFGHHLCHHLLLSLLLSSKHLWIIVDSSWSFASTISPFLMMTTSEIKKHTHTFS